MQLPIADGFYTSESLPFSAQRCVNWMPIIAQGAALNQKALLLTPGTVEFAANSGECRGAWTVKDRPYFVTGSSLVSLSPAGVVTNHGTINGTGRVSMADNGQYLVIVDSTGGANVLDGETLTPITDEDYLDSSTVVFMDGYFVFTAQDGSVFFNSALNDPFTIDPLDFGTAEISPDRIVAAHVNHNELFILGEDSVELFDNVGGTGFPFQRIAGANMQKGCFSPYAIASANSTFYFIGGDVNEKAGVWKVTGSASVQKISTDAIDTEIQKFSAEELAQAFSMTMSENGQSLIIFTFESDTITERTFAFNITASELSGAPVWFELQTGTTEGKWRAGGLVTAYGKLLVGDLNGESIGYLDRTVYTEYGNTIRRSRASQPYWVDIDGIFVTDLELTMESGVGLTTGQGSDPEMMMDYSDDGGRTWTSEFNRKIGKIGAYGQRVDWRRQGRIPRHRILRFSISDPVKANLLRLDGTVEVANG